MRRIDRVSVVAVVVAGGLCLASQLSAQTVRGTITDASTGGPVSLAGVHLLDRDRDTRRVAIADSLGHYFFTVPDSGEYILVAERFGYRDLESPLFAISDTRDYTLDLELQPAPLGLGGITVSVENDKAIDWIRREIGVNPIQVGGFRLLQGDRLAEAKSKGKFDPTETLRWLYIPVSHGPRCVAINALPTAASVSSRGRRTSLFGLPGEAPRGTTDPSYVQAEVGLRPAGCGSLMVNDRSVPNEFLDQVDMSQIAVVITLGSQVRMYTFDFNWAFR